MMFHGHHVQPYEIPAAIALVLLVLEVCSESTVRRMLLAAALFWAAIEFVLGVTG